MRRPYEDAPRLPEGDRIDVRSIVHGEWVELEVGPGRGWFLVERAQVEPRAALVGLEVRRKWAAVVDGRLAARGLGARARVFAEDAGIALPRFQPDATVRRIFVHFPDPWWKKRHRKRLVVQERFVQEVARLLEPDGDLFVQTDVEERAQAYEDLVSLDARFVPSGDGPTSPRLADNPYEARSPRERRAIADGLPVHRLRWRRAGSLVALTAVLAFASSASADSPITKGPYLTGLSDTSVDVRFELEPPQPATLAVKPLGGPADGGAPWRLIESHEVSEMRVLRVAALSPATHYAFEIRAGRAVLGSGDFTTAIRADSEAPVTFLLYGDDRTDSAAHAAIVRAMAGVPSDFLVNTGDLVEDGARASDWQSFFDVEAPLLRRRALFVAIGNHELYDDSAGANFAKYFGFVDAATGMPNLYGTARIGRVRFFFLNSQHDWASGDEHDWLLRELQHADGETDLKWRIAVTHHGPWSVGPHGPNPALVQAHVPDLLREHKVDLIFSGHDHIYDRGDAGGIKYVVSGGGGAPLYRVLGNDLTMRKAEASYHFVQVTAAADAIRIEARRVDGTVLDRCGFGKGLPWDCDPLVAAVEKEAVTPPAPTVTPPSPRCGCDVPGAGGSGGGFVLALALGAFGRRRSRVRPVG